MDDDPQLRKTIALTLVDAGYAVREAGDGLKALQVVAAATPDLILSDVKMPRLDGIELARSIARSRAPAPIILMSSGPIAPPGPRAPFIGKPFNLDALLDLISRVLAQASARHTNA
ncbi:MAG: response regulator [Thermomicrobiales bacterium]|nr:response regulator [Thermomicrobiales bacterium]